MSKLRAGENANQRKGKEKNMKGVQLTKLVQELELNNPDS